VNDGLQITRKGVVVA